MARMVARSFVFFSLFLVLVSVTLGQSAPPPSEQGGLQRQINELKRLVEQQAKEIEALKKKVGEKSNGAEGAKTPVAASAKQKVTVYGFVRTDLVRDSQAPNPNNQCPMYIESPDKAGIGSSASRLALYPRMTRIGFDLAAPEAYAGWKLGGKVEIDFQGGGAESRATPRARHMYIQASHGDTSMLAGLTWDLISPLFPSPADDSIMWNAGNLGDRRPQVRLTWDRPGSAVTGAVALGLTGAVDAKDLDSNGARDGEASGAPNLQARVGCRGRWGQAGIWGLEAREKVTTPVAGKTHFNAEAIGADVRLALSKTVDLSGEVWTGRNLSDFRGGIMQGVNAAAGREVMSTGGWLELGCRTSPKHRIAAGYSIDDPRDGDVPANGRIRNYAYYLHNKWTLAEPLDLGLNLLYWTTDYKGMRSGKDFRINLFAAYRF